ncbi:MAG: peptidase C39 family protein [Candidatus Micrarchaeaceae archaeon]
MVTIRATKNYNIQTYPQSEEFTSSAACALMVLKHFKKGYKPNKKEEFKIWQEAVMGSVWHGSRYGLAYALKKRGLNVEIISNNTKDEGYERKLAVYEGVNLDTLRASFEEAKAKVKEAKIKETNMQITINTIKREMSSGKIPIVLVNANAINPYLNSAPHWVVIKGYDKDAFYMNDPYSDSTITMENDVFKSALGYENEIHMLGVKAKS